MKYNKIIILIILAFTSFFLNRCSKKIPEFNSTRAFSYLKKQCSFGPRNPNSEGHELCKEFLVHTLKQTNAKVDTQSFTQVVRGEDYKLTNIIASFYPKRINRIILGTHWDTRPWADLDSLEENRNKPILGANDGASGVAVLLEMANIISENEPFNYGIDIILFDAEDAGEYSQYEEWCLGSKYFVESFEGLEPESIIIIDMIGDKNLNIEIEGFSYRNSPELVSSIWQVAHSLGIKEFQTKKNLEIYDDHYPFLEEGFNAIDIIDYDYPYWHTMEDTPDKCSPESLKKVGKVLTNIIYK